MMRCDVSCAACVALHYIALLATRQECRRLQSGRAGAKTSSCPLRYLDSKRSRPLFSSYHTHSHPHPNPNPLGPNTPLSRQSRILAMFSTKITRAAHRAITTTPSPAPSALSSASTCTAVHPTASRPSHQRRPSSSKASCPPDSSKPAPAAKGAAVTATSAEESRATAPSPKNVRKSRKGAYGARTSKVAEVLTPERPGQADQFAGLPAVPGVQHLGEKGMIWGHIWI